MNPKAGLSSESKGRESMKLSKDAESEFTQADKFSNRAEEAHYALDKFSKKRDRKIAYLTEQQAWRRVEIDAHAEKDFLMERVARRLADYCGFMGDSLHSDE